MYGYVNRVAMIESQPVMYGCLPVSAHRKRAAEPRRKEGLHPGSVENRPSPRAAVTDERGSGLVGVAARLGHSRQLLFRPDLGHKRVGLFYLLARLFGIKPRGLEQLLVLFKLALREDALIEKRLAPCESLLCALYLFLLKREQRLKRLLILRGSRYDLGPAFGLALFKGSQRFARRLLFLRVNARLRQHESEDNKQYSNDHIHIAIED
jgi:hypothetical protein